MHIGNGIICPVTGIPMLAIAGVTAFYTYKKAKQEFSKDKILPTVALTGLVFALQMINFVIPTTGSSGHIIGAILLSSLLGANVAFLAMCSILIVQSVFFADGGLLALGCNIFNMGFLACFVAYPLLFKPLEKINKPVLGAILSSIVALQLGSIAVVVEGALSGSITLSALLNFTLLMQAIHLPIGIVEGLATGLIVAVAKISDMKKLSYTLGAISILLAGVISHFASAKPDGLEWSLLNISDSVIMQTQGMLFNVSENLQHNLSVLAQMPYTLGSVAGLFVVVGFMYLICLFMDRKTVMVKNEK